MSENSHIRSATLESRGAASARHTYCEAERRSHSACPEYPTLKDFRSLQDFGSLREADDWLRAWSDFRAYLEQVSAGKDYKLILACDEYEILHEDIFAKDPDRARQLLGAMRSFSQHQNQVVFLFVGAKFFSELQNPNWNEYFVQVKHLHVDYLRREDTLKLVQRPTPDFNLIYPDDVANRIFDLTQGHPALIQQICSEMVNLANRSNHKHMTHDELNSVLDNYILHRENPAIQIFWTQFCAPQDRLTVKQILAGQPPDGSRQPLSFGTARLHCSGRRTLENPRAAVRNVAAKIYRHLCVNIFVDTSATKNYNASKITRQC